MYIERKRFEISRRELLAGGMAALAVATTGSVARANTEVIRWIVGYPPGGAVDAIARILTEPLSRHLGQTIIVENRPGAGSAIGATALAQSAPDGNTMMPADNGTLVINPAAYRSLSYDPERDFRPVALYAEVNIILAVGRDVPVQNAADFVEFARNAENPVPYASPGIGTPLHLAMERLAQAQEVEFEHIPYRGMAPALIDAIAGIVPCIVVDYTTAREMLESGDLRALGTFSGQRIAAMPDLPTISEALSGNIVADAWHGLVVPSGASDEIVERLAAAVASALEEDRVRQRYLELGLTIPASDTQSFTTRWDEDRNLLHPLIAELGISLAN